MPTIELSGMKVDYQVRHSRRASRARIDAGPNQITVVIPEGHAMSPEQFLREKESWVRDKHQNIQKYRERIPDRTFKEGEPFPYLGEHLPLSIERTRRSHVETDRIVLARHHVEQTDIKRQLENLYRRKARERIRDLIETYIDRIEESFEKLYIRNQKTRWGSCSSRDNLSFNWRLIMGPPHVLEYVVVHELVHLEHPDHSDSFWNRLKELYTNYPKSKSWLKNHHHKLVFETSTT